MTPKNSEIRPAGVLSVELEIEIAATPDRVWTALTEETDAWWPDDFLVTPDPRGVRLDPRPGGLLVEESADGGGLVWATVIAIEPPRAIHLEGQFGPPFGGPCKSLVWNRLESGEGGGTVFRLTDSVIGLVDEATRANLDEGWRALYGGGLKGYLGQPG